MGVLVAAACIMARRDELSLAEEFTDLTSHESIYIVVLPLFDDARSSGLIDATYLPNGFAGLFARSLFKLVRQAV